MKSSLSKSPLVGEKSMKESLVEVNSGHTFLKAMFQFRQKFAKASLDLGVYITHQMCTITD